MHIVLPARTITFHPYLIYCSGSIYTVHNGCPKRKYNSPVSRITPGCPHNPPSTIDPSDPWVCASVSPCLRCLRRYGRATHPRRWIDVHLGWGREWKHDYSPRKSSNTGNESMDASTPKSSSRSVLGGEGTVGGGYSSATDGNSTEAERDRSRVDTINSRYLS